MTQESKDVGAAAVRGLDPWGLRRVERLLQTVEGVDSLKIVPDGSGGIDEIHVLSGSGLGAKQIVRNIESALLAQFGLQVDHRKISIAQVTGRDLPSIGEAAPEEAPAPAASRPLLESFRLERQAGETIRCEVRLSRGDEILVGEAAGPDHTKSRLEVTAQAVLNALTQLASSKATLAIESVSEIQLAGRRLVLVVVQGLSGRQSTVLPGVCKVQNSVEESVVLACLSATNRWLADR
ncbi:MAG: hypothetical protein ACE5HQ_09155 [Gemmatimonadota bacterium]